MHSRDRDKVPNETPRRLHPPQISRSHSLRTAVHHDCGKYFGKECTQSSARYHCERRALHIRRSQWPPKRVFRDKTFASFGPSGVRSVRTKLSFYVYIFRVCMHSWHVKACQALLEPVRIVHEYHACCRVVCTMPFVLYLVSFRNATLCGVTDVQRVKLICALFLVAYSLWVPPFVVAMCINLSSFCLQDMYRVGFCCTVTTVCYPLQRNKMTS